MLRDADGALEETASLNATDMLLFDRQLAGRRLARAWRGGFADFLLARAADDLAERLEAITRDFAVAVDLGSPGDAGWTVLSRQPRIGLALRCAPRGSGGVRHVVADEEASPFQQGSLSLATSLLGLQGVNDLPGALVQIRRTLHPDGLFLGCMLGGGTLRELREAFAIAESETAGGVSPRVAPFADVRDAGGLLQRAGFALPVVDSEPVTVRYAHPLALFADLRAMGLGNALMARRRTPLRRDTLQRLVSAYAERFSDADGRVRATFELIWLSGWAPHESQQKPLKPGSAKARLAEALGAVERSAGDKAGG
jgi:SAM-dependent methyltransferase